jgi:hypothetical protein
MEHKGEAMLEALGAASRNREANAGDTVTLRSDHLANLGGSRL